MTADTEDDRAFAAAWKIVSAWDGKITKPVLRKAIDAAIAEALDGKWKPIETAPKDGTRILAFWSYLYPGDEHITCGIEIVEWNDGKYEGWRGEDGVAADGVNTHWMPLPSAPVANGGANG